ncbi:MAG TPA: glycosyltransferase family 39 protein, partial [Roseiflexaceae bacterium]|nr:glycosyltransferase family 39 protein [Roseiflexaceae bacterium]
MTKQPKRTSPGRAQPLETVPAAPVAIQRALDWSLALPLAVYALLSLACATAILVVNHGLITYTLDDGYIHLTLARNILRGHYGINPQEFAAPSSSILWPFLLAPFSALPQPVLVPILISLAASVGVIICLHRLASEVFAPLAERRQALVAATTTLLIPVTNLVGLPWTGMEHSLQVLLAVLVLMGLLAHHRSGVAPWWLGAVLVLGPLVRYENLVLSGPALLYLWWNGQRRTALLSGALLFAGLAGFSLFLTGIGQGFLPTSIVAKSFGSQSSSFALRIADGIVTNLLSVEGCLLLLGALLLLKKRSTADAPLVLVVTGAAGLHFVIGKFGWFSRYEIYIWTVTLGALLFCYRAELLALAQQRGKRLLVPALLLLAGLPYLRTQVLTPLATNNIYEQQFQISRFIAD